eukprot:2470811-Rhodomonas_salina.2
MGCICCSSRDARGAVTHDLSQLDSLVAPYLDPGFKLDGDLGGSVGWNSVSTRVRAFFRKGFWDSLVHHLKFLVRPLGDQD